MRLRYAFGLCLITVLFLSQFGFSADLTFQTTLLVENDVEIKSRLTGIVEQLFVERGSYVKKGDQLAKLKDDDLALQVQVADVNKRQMEAEYNRAKSLSTEKLISDSDYDAKRLSYEKAEAQYELAKAEYEKSIIRAPFNGVIVERYVKIGQRVVEDDDVTLFRLTAMEPLEARLFITEEQLAHVSQGMKAEFVPASMPDQHFAARVKWISPIVDAASGTAAVLVELSSSRGLKPGIAGQVVIQVSDLANKTK